MTKMKQKGPCGTHLNYRSGYAAKLDGSTGKQFLWCSLCEDYVVLSPAKDTPAVLIEKRAAELANLSSRAHMHVAEGSGWTSYGYDGDPLDLGRWNPQWNAGWLARHIYEEGARE